ncbi:tetratricopeptide repeat protein [Trichocoleus sp. FACHB-591]|uniref:tetratricopeptide repeat protein n=1 Tax=Trichocoleus sp. FACHB-591 TaxID=2692872 RepID=UPI0016889F47|nr:tetratricopeptide repeat protein [Trichocoleus sp. FACHB-591]MBD2096574.1 tetratricopeptide repeat protein [Trichocoleus sp. FACHB-591]
MNRIHRQGLSGFAVLLITIGLLTGIQETIQGQTKAPLSSEQKEARAEIERLNQQVFQLYKQGKFSEAIPLAEKVLQLSKRLFQGDHPGVAISLNNLFTSLGFLAYLFALNRRKLTFSQMFY